MAQPVIKRRLLHWAPKAGLTYCGKQTRRVRWTANPSYWEDVVERTCSDCDRARRASIARRPTGGA